MRSLVDSAKGPGKKSPFVLLSPRRYWFTPGINTLPAGCGAAPRCSVLRQGEFHTIATVPGETPQVEVDREPIESDLKVPPLLLLNVMVIDEVWAAGSSVA